jgi:Do/DeqQ family serine protease
MKPFVSLLSVALLSAVTTLGAYQFVLNSDSNFNFNKKSIVTVAPPSYGQTVGLPATGEDFTIAAEKAVHTVVHVKNVSHKTINNPLLEYFYGYSGPQQQEQIGTGSGVLISEDGYIVTNNHVIKEASEIEITLNNRKSYKAKLVGTDAKMDIALLKIETSEKLPYAVFADSDVTKVGEWVLAVGNPYNLNSTVTAGIISAKARNLDTRGIQSFIQTDAAVNPGNSGGALVNTKGELIGINTMISSQTGSYVGYSFAIPSNIARKIIQDIMEFGNVQRGMLGIEGGELNSATAKEFGVKQTEGFYIRKVNTASGAEKAGLKQGDIVVQLDQQPINSFAELNGYINTKRPKDKVQVTFIRNDKKMTVPVILSKNEVVTASYKGLELESLSATDKKKYKLNYGVKIKEINNANLAEYTADLKGAIIVSIGNTQATDIETATKTFSEIGEQQSVQLEIITTNGQLVRLIL